MTWYKNQKVNPSWSNMLLSQYLLKYLILNIYFELNYVFTGYPR